MRARKVFITGLWTAFSVAGIVSWFAPKVLGWYFEPPVNIGINCRPAVDWSMQKLQTIQMISLLVGFLAGTFVAYKFTRPRDVIKSPQS